MSEWISVKDSEPDSLDEVLTYSENEGIGISFYSNGSWYDYGTTKWVSVSHWMPLPEPPEE